jgi:hypothetical protein
MDKYCSFAGDRLRNTSEDVHIISLPSSNDKLSNYFNNVEVKKHLLGLKDSVQYTLDITSKNLKRKAHSYKFIKEDNKFVFIQRKTTAIRKKSEPVLYVIRINENSVSIEMKYYYQKDYPTEFENEDILFKYIKMSTSELISLSVYLYTILPPFPKPKRKRKPNQKSEPIMRSIMDPKPLAIPIPIFGSIPESILQPIDPIQEFFDIINEPIYQERDIIQEFFDIINLD